MIVPLADAAGAPRFGGKAARLAEALVAGLPVPDGWVLAPGDAERVAAAHSAPAWAERVLASGPIAVRSSAVGEDGQRASHAGQFCTQLGVTTPEALRRAVREVVASAVSDRATGYRVRMGLAATTEMAVVLQGMVAARVAGVLFTRHPISGADQRLIEASWGLGEAVVAGTVVPDRWVLAPGGNVIEFAAGVKTTRTVLATDGRAVIEEVPADQHEAPCLDHALLAKLDALASACDQVWSEPHDIEWAATDREVFLLQRRPITRAPA